MHSLMYHGSVIPSEPDIIPSNPSTVIDIFITVIRIHLFNPVFKFQRFWGLSRNSFFVIFHLKTKFSDNPFMIIAYLSKEWNKNIKYYNFVTIEKQSSNIDKQHSPAGVNPRHKNRTDPRHQVYHCALPKKILMQKIPPLQAGLISNNSYIPHIINLHVHTVNKHNLTFLIINTANAACYSHIFATGFAVV